MTAATLTVNRRNQWTGTRGNTPQVTIVHSPDVAMQKKIAHAAVEFILDEFGEEEANRLTLNEMIECLIEL